MRLHWKLPPTGELGLTTWHIIDVLLEFNGPQMVLLGEEDSRYLAVAIDEDPANNTERWIRASITATELDALMEGAIGPYDVLNKESLQVVDLDPGRQMPTVWWNVERSVLSEQHLPAPDARLPESIVRPARRQPAPTLRLDGGAVNGSKISFLALGDVLKNFQRLWAALAQVAVGQPTQRGALTKELLDRAELSASRLQPGSVHVQVEPTDEALFAEIGESYARLVAARYDDQQLVALLQEFEVRVRSAYRDYLESLEKHDLQLYAKWNDSRVFVGPNIARAVRPKLRAIQEAGRAELEAFGTFEAFSIPSASFSFYDVVAEEAYSGSVAPDFSVDEREISIGPAAFYEVHLSVLMLEGPLVGPKSRYQLLGARRVQSIPPTVADEQPGR